MSSTKLIHRSFNEGEAVLDWVKYRLRKHRQPGQYHIQAYRGHGTSDALYISGRVVEGDPVPAANQDDAVLRNLWYTLRRLGSDEVPLARVKLTSGETTVTVLADDEGFFEARLPAPTAAPTAEVWREIALELIDPVSSEGPVSTSGYSIVPSDEAQFGIISDIDDTVVKTDVANAFRMIRLVLLTNAHTRLPFAGVASFYRALHAGKAGPTTNPIFYVSSSPWNFYDLLMEVFHVHDVPPGPLYLKDFGLARDLLLSRGHMEHKLSAIAHIFETHPSLSFVLIGDSGQKDPEVYREVVNRFPDRVLAIYIRDVSPEQRDHQIKDIAADLSGRGVPMLIVADTPTAAAHAASLGLIDPSSLPEIRGERAQDLRSPGPLAGLVKG